MTQVKYERNYINNKLQNIVNDDLISFHMPGHKKGKIYDKLGYGDLVKNLYKMDTTEIIETDNLHSPEGIIKDSQERTSKIFRSEKSYYLVNGSTCGIQAAILSTCSPGEKILVNRDCHQSAINTFILGDINPIYIKGSICEDTYTIKGVNEKDVLDAIDDNSDIKVLMLTYPSYYGMVFDLEKICTYAHEKGIVVIVDEAHGAHLGLSDKLPKSALEQGADIVIQSIHKTLPSFTQSSIIHVQGDLIDKKNLERFLKIVQSSSPSYVMMASLEIAIDIYDRYGKDLMQGLLSNIDDFEKDLSEINGVKVLKGHDKTKVFVSLKDLGINGYDLEETLRYKYNIQVELSNYYGVLLICTIGNEKDDFDKFLCAIKSIVEDLSGDKNNDLDKSEDNVTKLMKLNYPDLIPQKIISPREAFYSDKKAVLLKESIGKISGEYIIPYPPGISLTSPGEIITQEVIDYILACKQYGMHVSGLKDSSLEIIEIIEK
ncbi:aminotransferase class I/II-fold pyridoxal phosphate-dependent enzyme [Intestinibacter sp.]|uniref:aminotransferase class I/II-fold pyridoxal phosphate-dependent enzyme n=1 Tax=Intestinibacter sp. TaxID=1965304 RepID=UPI002A91E6EE|nr:aminotransferase class I/II-fold pyridoxal phosphate-dependent enzyme [Intestinibacter sp.]MDY5212733.1 aminotransferase class I/II-fold pyridoxal phosphate-dependent enzyme [Intestinibacter sp.]